VQLNGFQGRVVSLSDFESISGAGRRETNVLQYLQIVFITIAIKFAAAFAVAAVYKLFDIFARLLVQQSDKCAGVLPLDLMTVNRAQNQFHKERVVFIGTRILPLIII